MKHALKELFGKSGSGRQRSAEDAAPPSFTPENPATPGAGGQQAAQQQHGWFYQQQQQEPGNGTDPAGLSADHPDLGQAALQVNRQQDQQQQQQQAARLQPEQQPQAQQQLQQGPQQQDPESSVIAVAEHCPAAMLKDTWSLQAFDLRAKLYAGHISSVYRAVDKKSGITVGLKLYKRQMLNDMERHQIAREIWLHIQLNHPSIIALYAAWKDRDYIYLVLEWAPEGNVFTFLQQSGGRLPESVVVPMILEPTMSALHYIHGLGMIHRDVKPENILLTTSYQIKLADFGLSIHSNYEVANTRLGTIDYLSPEILDCPVKQHPQDHKVNPQKWYTCKVDVWSIGVLAYELLLGRTPFEARTPQETLYKIKTQEVSYPAELSEGATAFIKAALVRDPERRASLTDLLQHPWLLKHMRSSTGPPHMRGRTQTQSEVAVLQCFPGTLGEMRTHASSGNMRPPVCVSSADGVHNSCPQVLHSQLSAPAAELAHAAGLHSGGHLLAGQAGQHTPSPLGSQQPKKQPPLSAAAGAGAAYIKAGSMAHAAADAAGGSVVLAPVVAAAGFGQHQQGCFDTEAMDTDNA